MRLTEEQIQAIISDTADKLYALAEDPCNGDYSDLDFYEDDEGRCYSYGSKYCEREIEEICINGLPGISPENSDIIISATCGLDFSYHDDYDAGDYWTPLSGGIEIDSVDIELLDMEFEINVPAHVTNEYVCVDIPKEVKQRIITEVNERIWEAC